MGTAGTLSATPWPRSLGDLAFGYPGSALTQASPCETARRTHTPASLREFCASGLSA